MAMFIQCNTGARSRNHCCRGKAKRITLDERVCILTLVIRYANQAFSASYYCRTRLHRHERDRIFRIVVNGCCSNRRGYVMVNSDELIVVSQKIRRYRRVTYTDVVITGLTFWRRNYFFNFCTPCI